MSGGGVEISPVTAAQVKTMDMEKTLPGEGEGSAGFFSCSINLLKSVIGAGILTIPFALSQLGWVPGLLTLLLAAVLSTFGLYLLSILGHSHGRKSTFGAVAEKIFPKMAVWFDVAVMVKCLGVASAYLAEIVSIIPDVVKGFMIRSAMSKDSALTIEEAIKTVQLPYWVTLRPVGVAMALVVLAPIASMRKMDSLKYTSFFGMFAMAYLLVLCIYEYISLATKGAAFPIKPFVPLSLTAFRAFSIFVFAFNCHQNIFPIQNEARNNTPKWMSFVISTVMSISLGIYIAFGLFSYGSYEKLDGSILKSYPLEKIPYIIGRFLFMFLLACSYPLQSFPCRMSIERIVKVISPKMAESRPLIIYWASTAFIILVTAAVATPKVGLDIILAIIGATAGPAICYIFPAILYLKQTQKQGPTKLRWAAKGLLAVSIPSTILSIVAVILKIVDMFKPKSSQ
jgi:amino acid permease